jgi:hypothetical protein
MNFENCVVKWNNGAWKLFDEKEYKDIACFFNFEELANMLFESKE